MSIPHNAVLLICISIFMSLSPLADSACTYAGPLFKEIYYTLVDEMQRGAPKSIAASYFAEFKSQIGRWALDNYPKHQSFGSRCIPDNITQPLLTSDRRLLSLQTAIAQWKAEGHSPAYLPPADFPRLPLFSRRTVYILNFLWGKESKFLSYPPQSSYMKILWTFPNFHEVMYDPHRGAACKEAKMYGMAGGHSLTADRSTIRVIGLVVRLHLLGVPKENAFQILFHHSAYVFDWIRCMQRDYNRLSIPLVFSPIYSAVAAALSSDLDTSAVPTIPDHIVEEYYMDLVKCIAFYRSWGKNGAIQISNGETSFVLWKDIIFEPERLDKVRLAIGVDLESRARNHLGGSPSLNGTNRNQALCSDGWVWEEQAIATNNIQEKCCSRLCYASVLDQSVLADGIVECCHVCNQISCLGHHDTFDLYYTVVPRYGDLMMQVIPVYV